jgi:hypothetical protein
MSDSSPIPPLGSIDFNRLLSEATFKLARVESPEETSARLELTRYKARVDARVRMLIYSLFSLLAIGASAVTLLTNDAYRRGFARDVAIAIITGLIGYFLGRKDQ